MDGAFPSRQGEDFSGDKRGFRGNAENAKTKLCMRWQEGHCRFAERCNFAHGEHELRGGQGRGGGGGGGYHGGPGANNWSQGPGPYMGGGHGGAPGGYNRNFGPQAAGYTAAFPRPEQTRGNFGPQGAMGYGQPPQQQWMGGMDGRGPQPHGAHGGMSEQAWIANGCPRPGPGGWTQYRTQEQEFYYHNAQTNETTWEKPPGWM